MTLICELIWDFFSNVRDTAKNKQTNKTHATPNNTSPAGVSTAPGQTYRPFCKLHNIFAVIVGKQETKNENLATAAIVTALRVSCCVVMQYRWRHRTGARSQLNGGHVMMSGDDIATTCRSYQQHYVDGQWWRELMNVPFIFHNRRQHKTQEFFSLWPWLNGNRI